MIVYDRHEVVLDLYEDGSDVWVAAWQNDGLIHVYHGDEINNKAVMHHVSGIPWIPLEDKTTEKQIKEFCEHAGNILHNMTKEYLANL